MTTSDIYVPLKLIECEGGGMRGKVRLQKLAFLIQQMDGTIDYEFEPAPLGPLSYKLGDTMAQLQKLGLVEEEAGRTASGNAVFCYRLTGRGRSLLKVARGDGGVSKELQATVRQIQREYGAMGYVDLLEFVHGKYPAYHLRGISLGDFSGAH